MADFQKPLSSRVGDDNSAIDTTLTPGSLEQRAALGAAASPRPSAPAQPGGFDGVGRYEARGGGVEGSSHSPHAGDHRGRADAGDRPGAAAALASTVSTAVSPVSAEASKTVALMPVAGWPRNVFARRRG